MTITPAQIRELREKRLRLKRDEFAFVLGVTTQSVVNWETSRNTATPQMGAILSLLRSTPLKTARRAVKRQLDKPMGDRANEERLEQLLSDLAEG